MCATRDQRGSGDAAYEHKTMRERTRLKQKKDTPIREQVSPAERPALRWPDRPGIPASQTLPERSGHAFSQVRVHAGQTTPPGISRTAAPLLQREELTSGSGDAPPSFNPLDPAMIRQVSMAVVQEREVPLRTWLNANTDQIRRLSPAGVRLRLRRSVPEASGMADAELDGLIRRWAAEQGITLPPVSLFPEPGELAVPAPGGPELTLPDSALIDAIRRGFTIATEGIEIRREHGRANVSVSGATVQLLAGGAAVKGTVGWSGSFGFQSAYRDVRFGAELSAECWTLKLNIGDEPAMLNPERLARIFEQGEQALRGIVAATREFQSVDDAAAFRRAAEPHIQPLKQALSTLSDIAAADRRRIGAGISISGPMGQPEAGGGDKAASGGIEIKATLTIQF